VCSGNASAPPRWANTSGRSPLTGPGPADRSR
jgi:hypothetical protein